MIPRRTSVPLLLVVSLLVALTATGGPTESRAAPGDVRTTVRVLARLDRDVITEFELARYMGRRIPATTERLPSGAQRALVDMIILKLESRAAKARGVEVPPRLVEAALARRVQRLGGPERFAAMLRASPTSIEDIRAGLRDVLAVRRFYTHRTTAPLADGEAPLRGRITPGEAREHFRANRERYVKPGRARVGLIEIRPTARDSDGGLARARALLDRLTKGEDFASLAREASRGPRAADGGDLGWLEPGNLDPRIDAFVFASEKGAVSDPIRSPRGGWWIVRVIEREPGEALSFKEAQAHVARELRTERLTKLRRLVLARLVKDALIEPASLREMVVEAAKKAGEPARP